MCEVWTSSNPRQVDWGRWNEIHEIHEIHKITWVVWHRNSSAAQTARWRARHRLTSWQRRVMARSFFWARKGRGTKVVSAELRMLLLPLLHLKALMVLGCRMWSVHSGVQRSHVQVNQVHIQCLLQQPHQAEALLRAPELLWHCRRVDKEYFTILYMTLDFDTHCACTT